jgi:hypothetical protein
VATWRARVGAAQRGHGFREPVEELEQRAPLRVPKPRSTVALAVGVPALRRVLDGERVIGVLAASATKGVPWSVTNWTSRPAAASATTRATRSAVSRSSMAKASNRLRSRSPMS